MYVECPTVLAAKLLVKTYKSQTTFSISRIFRLSFHLFWLSFYASILTEGSKQFCLYPNLDEVKIVLM